MTLDVKIGQYYLDENNKPSIKRCEDSSIDICNIEYTMWPKDAYRSGSTSFWHFFKKKDPILIKLYYKWRKNPNTNDDDVCKFDEEDFKLIDEILPLSDPIDKDRLKWLRYWMFKAREEYGKLAGIEFR